MQNKLGIFSSFWLHIFAMIFMLCDHMWATVLPRYSILTCIGRIAFPIFAFMIVEGFFHTHNVKKYMLRMLVFAVVTEIPFNLMVAGTPIYLFHQNVLWTFLLSIGMMYLLEKVRAKESVVSKTLLSALIVFFGFILGYVTMVDYFGAGILTVMIFYFFRGKNWWCYLGQLIGMWVINVEMLGGFYYPITIFGIEFELIQQGIALLALIPIWLYSGKQGYHAKWFQYFCYAFYPLHCLVLYLIMTYAL